MDHLQRSLLSAFVAGIVLNFAGPARSQSMPSTPSTPSTSSTPSTPSTQASDPQLEQAPASGMSNTMNQPASSTTPLAFDSPAAGGGEGGYSWLPYTTRGYVGVNGGQAQIDDLPCSPFYSCDDNSNSAFKVYTGGMFNNHFGLELAYFNTGNIDRSGGRVRAHGGNLSFVAQAPLGNVAAVYAKVGASYAWTKTSVGPLALGTPSGEESDVGAAYGVGVRFNASKNWAVVVEWEQHELQFAGDEKQGTMFTTVGLQYRF